MKCRPTACADISPCVTQRVTTGLNEVSADDLRGRPHRRIPPPSRRVSMKCRPTVCADYARSHPDRYASPVSMKCGSTFCADYARSHPDRHASPVSMKCGSTFCADTMGRMPIVDLRVSMKCRPTVCADQPSWIQPPATVRLNEVSADGLRGRRGAGQQIA